MRTWGGGRGFAWFAVILWLLFFAWLYSVTGSRLFVYACGLGVAGYFAFVIMDMARRFLGARRR